MGKNDFTFRDLGVPDDATFEAIEGLGGDPAYDVQRWIVKNTTTDFGQEGHASMRFSNSKDCIPIDFDLLAKGVGFWQKEYYNVTIGISDPDLLDPTGEHWSDCKPKPPAGWVSGVW